MSTTTRAILAVCCGLTAFSVYLWILLSLHKLFGEDEMPVEPSGPRPGEFYDWCPFCQDRTRQIECEIVGRRARSREGQLCLTCSGFAQDGGRLPMWWATR